MLGIFRRKTDAPDFIAREALKARLRALAGYGEDVSLAINEIVCADPACPGTETVILVMQPGRRTRALKVQAPIAEVTDAMLQDALETGQS